MEEMKECGDVRTTDIWVISKTNYNKTLVKLYVKLGETAASPKETTNCFYDRLQLIKQINDQ